MKYKTLFRLALKVLGVYFIALSVVDLWWVARQVLDWVYPPFTSSAPFSSNVNTANRRIQEILSMCFWVVKPGVGLYLFFGGEWIVNKAIPSNRSYCHECGYLLKDLKGTRCPECDTPFTPHGSSTP